jgi:hypothetical protein
MNQQSDTTISTLRDALRLPVEQIETTRLCPIFVPSSFFTPGNWPGPYLNLRAKRIGLTWTVMFPDQTMRYVDHSMATYWEGKGLDWRKVAVSNLREHTGDSLGTHEFRRLDGSVYAIAMMHSDGVGPSRILLRQQLSKLFPEGYRIGVPEMSCGIAFSTGVEESEMNKVRSVIEHCFQDGTRPLAPGIYDPDDLLPDTN